MDKKTCLSKKINKIVTKILIVFKYLCIKRCKERDAYLLWDCLSDPKVESIDAYSLFRYMISHDKNAYYVLLEESVLFKKLRNENNLKNIIPLKNSAITAPLAFLSAIKSILKETRYVATSFDDVHKTLRWLFKKDKCLEYIFLQHGVTFFKESVFLKKYISAKKYDKFLVTFLGEFELFQRNGFAKDKLLLSGFPRWDYLERQDDGKGIFMMFTWRHFDDADIEKSLYYRNILSLLHNQELISCLNEHNIKIYFAFHHQIAESMKSLFAVAPYIEIVNHDMISSCIKKSSMFVTDFSSVVFDFMFLGKPVVLYGLDHNDENLSYYDSYDLDKLKQKCNVLPTIFFDEEAVVKSIIGFIERGFELNTEMQKIYSEFFTVKNNICKHLIEEIEKVK